MKISKVMKCNMIICKFQLRLTNPVTLAIATLLSFEILQVSCLFFLDMEKSTDSLLMIEFC